MSFPCWRACAVLVALLVLPSAGVAQWAETPVPGGPVPVAETDALVGTRIAEIRVVGGRGLSSDTVGYYLEVAVGDPYDEAQLRRGFRRLWDSGLVDDLRIDREEVAGGVAVVVHVQEKPRLEGVDFEGNRKVSNSELEEMLEDLDIKAGSVLTTGRAARIESAIRTLYEQGGYTANYVAWRLEPEGGAKPKLIITVDEGDRNKVQTISFVGNDNISDRKLRFKMKPLKAHKWWKFWAKTDVYNENAWGEASALLKSIYRENGFKDIHVGKPTIEYENYEVRQGWRFKRATERRVNMVIPIKEGKQFSYGDLKIIGAEVFPAEVLVGLFPIVPGEVMQRSRLDEGLASLEEKYRDNGYIYVFSNPEFTEREGAIVDIEVQLTEGKQFELGRVEFVGNSTTRDKVLRRELKLTEGDIMNMGAMRTSLFKIQQLGFFRLDEEPIEFAPNPETEKVDVRVHGEEFGRNDVQFGGGYSEIDGFFGQFQFSTRNFLGNGETLGLNFQSGRRRTLFEFGYTNPWFMDRRVVLGTTVFRRELNISNLFDREEKGLSGVLGFRLKDFATFSAFYNFRDVEQVFQTVDFSDDQGGGAGGEGGDDGGFFGPTFDADPVDDGPDLTRVMGRTSSLTPSFSYDTRNDPFDPWIGTRMSASVEVAGGLFGGDDDFLKPELRWTRFQPITQNFGLGFNFGGGWIIPFNNGDVPPFERYYLGGERTIRGYSVGTIFPRDSRGLPILDEEGSFRLGGDRFMQFNFETIFRVGGPLKLVLFADAGNTWIDDDAMQIDEMLKTVGAELRIFLPIFQAPLRFIWGYKLDPRDGEKRDDFQFSIGSTF